ncbi:hypothetical protein JOM56_007062 [Amanita muscaria]
MVEDRQFSAFLRNYAYGGNAFQAAHISAKPESKKDSKPTLMSYKSSIQTQVKLRSQSKVSRIPRDLPPSLGADNPSYDQSRVSMVPNDQRLSQGGMPEQAIELVEVMINSSSTGSCSLSAKRVPQPASSTFTAVLARFSDSGDVEMVLV